MWSRKTKSTKLCTPRLTNQWIRTQKPKKKWWYKYTMISFSGYFKLKSDWKYSIGLWSYGSWSAECCEYLANFNAECLEMVPSQGWRAPVMRWSRVDLPVPLAPRIATRESILVERRVRDGRGRYGRWRKKDLLDTKREIIIEVLFFFTWVRESDRIKGNDGWR